MDEVRQAPPSSQIGKKRKAPELPLSIDDASTRRSKPSEPGGLVPNWKQKTDLVDNIARKNPIESINDEDVFIEGEFNGAEGSDMQSAARAFKYQYPTVKIDRMLVRDYHI